MNTMTYTASGHRISSIYPAAAVTYSYDKNGNLKSGNGRTTTYTVNNKPKTITKGGFTDSFRYSPNQQRWKRTQSGATPITTFYINKSFEYVIEGCDSYSMIILGPWK
jgi:hypothetical protein